MIFLRKLHWIFTGMILLIMTGMLVVTGISLFSTLISDIAWKITTVFSILGIALVVIIRGIIDQQATKMEKNEHKEQETSQIYEKV